MIFSETNKRTKSKGILSNQRNETAASIDYEDILQTNLQRRRRYLSKGETTPFELGASRRTNHCRSFREKKRMEKIGEAGASEKFSLFDLEWNFDSDTIGRIGNCELK